MRHATQATLLFLLANPLFGAANITLSSFAIPSNGRTVTATASASISTSSSLAACFTPHGTASTAASVVSSATSNGTTTVTINLSAPAYTGDTVTMDVLTVGAGCSMQDGSGNTPQGQTGVAATNSSEYLAIAGATVSAKAQFTGNPASGTFSGYPTALKWSLGGGSVDVNATGSEIDLWAFGYTVNNELQQDGVTLACPGNCKTPNPTDCCTNSVTQAADPASTTYQEIVLGTGLSGTHTYRLINGFGQVSGIIVAAVRFVGGGVTGVKPAAQRIIQAAGESNSGCGGSGPVDCLQYDTGILSYYSTLGTVFQNGSVAGNTVSQIKDKANYFSDNGNCSVTPTALIYNEWSNDYTAMTSVPSFTADTVTALGNLLNIVSLRNANFNACPALKAYVLGPSNPAASAYGTALQSAISTVNVAAGSTIATYIPTVAWVSNAVEGCPAHDWYTDGLHLCGAESLASPGQGAFANHEIPVLASQISGAAFSVAGSSTGTVGVANTYTLTLANGATWAGTSDQTLTITSSVAGDTVCIAATCARHTVTAVVGLGATASISLAASNAGARTLTYSGLASGWTAPSPNTFTATGNSGGAVMVGGVALSGALGIQ